MALSIRAPSVRGTKEKDIAAHPTMVTLGYGTDHFNFMAGSFLGECGYLFFFIIIADRSLASSDSRERVAVT